MADSNVGITIPKQLIDDLVRAEIVRAIGKREEMIAHVVNQVLNEKEDNYSRETRIERAFRDMIIGEAKALLQEWLLQNKDEFRKSLMAHFNDHKAKRLKEMAEALTNGLLDSYINVNVNFHKKDGD